MHQAVLDILAAFAPATSAAAPSKRKRSHTPEPSTDRVHIPTNRWETPDSQNVVALTDFFGDAASGRPGVPVGQTRTGISFALEKATHWIYWPSYLLVIMCGPHMRNGECVRVRARVSKCVSQSFAVAIGTRIMHGCDIALTPWGLSSLLDPSWVKTIYIYIIYIYIDI